MRRAALASAVVCAGALAHGAPSPTAPALAPVEKSVPVNLEPFRFQVAAVPAAGWMQPGFDDRSWAGPAPGPFAPRQPPLPTPPPVATLFDAVRGAPLLLRARFAVADPTRVRVLELRIAYADGFVAYVNGHEVARRGMNENGAPPAVPHGPETERLYVTVPSAAIPSLTKEGNVLALAVYAYPGRSAVVPTAPATSIALAAASGVRIVRGPYLIDPVEEKKHASVSVAWETDLPVPGRVLLSREGATDAAEKSARRIESPAPATRHVARLSGLEHGAHYRYQVETGEAMDMAHSEPASFETLPASPAPLRFAVYGDMRYPGHDAHRAVVAALVREKPALVLNTGDLTDEGSQESNWQRYFDITAPLGAIAPVVPALGNHDAARGGAGEPITWKLFGVPAKAPPGWTSFDIGDVHFVILDTNAMRDPDQRPWLAADLARAERRHPRAVFAFCHEPPWSHALHGNSSLMIREYAPVLAAGHVDLLFAGHDHIYERGVGQTPSGKLSYVVTGGGGAPLYDPTCAAASGPPPGVAGTLPACPPNVAVLTKTYHYIMVEVSKDGISFCPRRPDGSPVEACVHLPPHARR
jgi:hypothetical protein